MGPIHHLKLYLLLKMVVFHCYVTRGYHLRPRLAPEEWTPRPYHLRGSLTLHHIPYAPCMEYSPTFGLWLKYMEHLGMSNYHHIFLVVNLRTSFGFDWDLLRTSWEDAFPTPFLMDGIGCIFYIIYKNYSGSFVRGPVPYSPDVPLKLNIGTAKVWRK